MSSQAIEEIVRKTYIGSHDIKVDPKGRVSVPAVFRRILERKTKAKDLIFEVSEVDGQKRLNCYDLASYERNKKQIDHGNIIIITPDSQGRVLLPVDTRRALGLEDRVYFRASKDGTYFFLVNQTS